jgi:DNA helicase-2/ATP-dependent DNA helicase PcrA
MTDGIFPSRRTIEERKVEGLEEERRLCYVAMTRAMQELYMVESEGSTYGETRKLPSRFIYDVDQSYLNTTGVVSDDIIKALAVKIKKQTPGGSAAASFQKRDSVRKPVLVSASPRKYGAGDIVAHRIFGAGEITDIDEANDAYMIKFLNSEKPKPISVNYPGLTLFEGDFAGQSLDALIAPAPSTAAADMKAEKDKEILRELEKQLESLLPAGPKNQDAPPSPIKSVGSSNFNRKLDRHFANKKDRSLSEPVVSRPMREPEVFDFPEEIDDAGDAVLSVPQSPVSENDLGLYVGEDEITGEISAAPVALYDAPPQILYDNDTRVNLWDDPNVPKKGWICVDVIDLGQPYGECGMCGKEDIRYVHIMRHEKHQSIGAGCVCGGKMEGDINTAKERENALKNKISRFRTFSVTEFKTSAKGNLYTKYKNTVITFVQSKNKNADGGWTFVENGEFSSYYKTLDEAKRAAFEKVDGRRE